MAQTSKGSGRRGRAWALVAITALVLPVVISGPALATHSWSGYHWARTANPLTLKIGDNVTAAWDSHLSTASTDWSASAVLDTTVVAGGTKPNNCRATLGRVEVCNARYGQNGWLGLAQIWLSGTHITQGTAKMNDTYFSLAQYNTPAERAHVMCQEVGHTFGLGHQDETGASLGTCMDYANDSSNSQHPNTHDFDMLATIYNDHLDSSNTAAASAAGASGLDVSDRSQWGQRVRAGAAGRNEVYVRNFGNGQAVVTFVTLAR